MFQKLTGPRTLYTAEVGGSDLTGDGTEHAPFRTMGHAYNWAADNLFLAGHKLTISPEPGIVTGFATGREIYGSGTCRDVEIRGRGARLEDTIVVPPPGSPYAIQSGLGDRSRARFTVLNFTVQAPSGTAFHIFGGELFWGGIVFDRCGQTFVTAAHCTEVGPIDYCWAKGGPTYAERWTMVSAFATNTLGHISWHGKGFEHLGFVEYTQGYVSVSNGGQFHGPPSIYGKPLVSGLKACAGHGGMADCLSDLPGNGTHNPPHGLLGRLT